MEETTTEEKVRYPFVPRREITPAVVAEEIMPALEKGRFDEDAPLMLIDIGVEGMLVGYALQTFGLDNPTIGEFKKAAEDYLLSR